MIIVTNPNETVRRREGERERGRGREGGGERGRGGRGWRGG